ncbi:Checkpoint protein Hus1/Mec3 [Carpediemonas membranifera]|uniref:Checkpoint protein n=1 Tax=Carpediemonas membranifera TaxID=201153 RepID=A0A8J6BDT4_9EUKA|nr:Checkpoint protein Hus1/Mec3 [Carpediemonas membranifera]|eukprot:KAG9395397.1 Checkpoint protein Hus1/Mec3 [Carpediemonas membranifera]
MCSFRTVETRGRMKFNVAFATGESLESFVSLLKYFSTFSCDIINCTFGPDDYGVIFEGNSSTNVQINCRAHVSSFFQQYSVQSRYQNLVGFQIETTAFIRALKVQPNTTVRFQLAISNSSSGPKPLLRIMHKEGSSTDKHEITVALLIDDAIERIRTENAPDGVVGLFLPKIESVLHVAKVMLKNDPVMKLLFDRDEASLTLSTESTMVNMETTFDNIAQCDVMSEDAEANPTIANEVPAQVKGKVHCKDIVPALDLADLRPTDVIMSFIETGQVWLLAMLPSGSGPAQILTVCLPRAGR